MQAETEPFSFPQFNEPRTSSKGTIIKHLAVHRLGSRIFNALELLNAASKLATYCEHPNEALISTEEVKPSPTDARNSIPVAAIQANVFNWSLKDCVQRLPIDIVWLNIMRMQFTSRCLELKKVNTDFKELFKFIRLILQGYLSGQNKFENVFEQLWEVEIYNNIEDSITKEFNQTETQDQTQRQSRSSMKALALLNTKRKFELENQLNPTEAKLDAAVKIRYELNYHKSEVCQAEILADREENAIEQKIAAVERKMEYETKTFNTISNTYSQQIEDLRYQVYSMTSKYDMDFKDIDETVIAVKLKIKNLNLRRQFMDEQLERFREEMAARQAELLERQKLLDAEEERQRLLREKKEMKKASRHSARQKKRELADKAKIEKMAKQLRKAAKTYRNI